MPIYNVQAYLEQAIVSLFDQEWRNIEIIAIDDGSTDDSATIIDTLAARDERIVVIHQENRGLGSARNVGVAAASGTYLAFLDSDDLAESRGYRRAIESLESSGSDFAVCSYRLLVNGRATNPGSWIGRAHEAERRAVTLEQCPEIQVNAIACSKVYRTSFFRQAVGEFPTDVLYEDQLPASRAYVRARSFDVLKESLIQWRMRSDASSITQQNASPDNLQAVVLATESSVSFLQEHAPDAARARVLQLLLSDTYKLRNLARADEAYWQVLCHAIDRWWPLLSSDELIESVPIGRRVAYAMTRWATAREAADYVAAGGLTDTVWVFEEDEHGLLRGRFPDYEQRLEALVLPSWLFRAGRADLNLHSCVERVDSRGGSLIIRGSAYLAGLSPDEISLAVSLVGVDNICELALPVVRVPSERAAARTAHRELDYRASGFECVVNASDVVALLEEIGGEQLALGLRISASYAGIGRTATIFKTDFLRSEAAVHSCVVGDRGRVDFAVRNDLPVIRATRPAPLVVESLAANARRVDLVLRDRSVRVTQVAVLHPGEAQVTAGVDPGGSIVCYLPVVNPGDTKASRLKLLDGDGRWRSLALDQNSAVGQAPDGELVVAQGYFDQPFFFEGAQHAFVQSVEVSGTELRVLLRMAASVAGERHVVLAGPGGRRINGVLVSSEGPQAWYAFQCESQDRAGWSSQLVAPGRYSLRVMVEDGASGTRPLRVQCGETLLRMLPLRRVGDGALRADFLRGPEISLVLDLMAHGEGDHRPVPTHHALVKRYQRLDVELRPQVYFQCLRGDQVGDSLLPIAAELKAINPGLRIVWGVTDWSIAVPESHHRVVIGSPQYFEALTESAVLIFNHELPRYFVKKSGQVVVQTYHGHPFKMMGISRFKQDGYSAYEIERSLDARSVWDYLLSPSPIATRLYQQNFPLDYEVIEVGHPRNDSICRSEASLRAAIRESLGIPEGTRALLYAPTWRDYAATSAWRSEMVVFFDPAELSAQLGPDYVILLRGHPAHGRHRYQEATGEGVIDVTLYPDVNDLIIASDIGLFDYSSIRFDFAVTGRPMVFFVPDKERYFSSSPGLLPYHETTPGPQISTVSDLVATLVATESWVPEYVEAYRAFQQAFCPMDDGNAAKRFVDVLGDRLAKRVLSPWGPEWQFREQRPGSSLRGDLSPQGHHHDSDSLPTVGPGSR